MIFARKLLRNSISAINIVTAFSRPHSSSVTTKLRDMKIRLVSALDDNYMYLLIDEQTGTCAAVDPVEPDKFAKLRETRLHWYGQVERYGIAVRTACNIQVVETCGQERPAVTWKKLTENVCHEWKLSADCQRNTWRSAASREEGVEVSAILTTHHHWDHAGGNEQLLKLLKGDVKVYGGDNRIGGLTHKVKQGDMIQLGKLSVKCLSTPCHTTGHICYYVTSGDGAKPDEPAVFTGDTLFSGGCGRFFEGSPSDMYTALIEILGKLQSNTKVFCGHEYTVQNLKYAIHAEPDNKEMQAKLAWAQDQRSKGLPTIPSTIAEEMKINPFMRLSSESIQKHTGKTAPIDVMGSLRREKDSFRPR